MSLTHEQLTALADRLLEVPGVARVILAGPEAASPNRVRWGPWVDGGGWLTIDGTAVDWIYRNLDRVHASWRGDAQLGRYMFHWQVGHPLGVPDFAYAGEVALGVVLADPTRELTDLQHSARHYPDTLRRTLREGLGRTLTG